MSIAVQAPDSYHAKESPLKSFLMDCIPMMRNEINNVLEKTKLDSHHYTPIQKEIVREALKVGFAFAIEEWKTGQATMISGENIDKVVEVIKHKIIVLNAVIAKDPILSPLISCMALVASVATIQALGFNLNMTGIKGTTYGLIEDVLGF